MTGVFSHLQPVPRPAGPSAQRDALCEELSPGQALLRLEVRPPKWAEIGQPVANAIRMGEMRGGHVELGWQLWETLPRVLLEAEFHAVWLDADGERHDITPKAFPGITAIRFLPDPGLTYEGAAVPSYRVPLVDDDAVRELIEAEDAFFRAHGGATVLNESARSINADRVRLAQDIVARYYSGD